MKVLCDLQDIAQAGAKEFQIILGGQLQDIFVVHHQHKVYGYKNICPHQGLTLNWLPGQFLNHDGTLIQCSNHDALFRIEDGVCVSGPCIGKQLSPLDFRIDSGNILLVKE